MGALEFRQGQAGAFDPGDVRHVRKIEFEPPCVVDLRQQADFEQAGAVEQEVARAELRQPLLTVVLEPALTDFVRGLPNAPRVDATVLALREHALNFFKKSR